ncbi:hypothetical protein AC16_5336 [Escherichia coli 2-177-06_S3_C2]|nr:hypothetical protein CV83906_4040 [Escherichia coli]EGX23958.1 hypothetical protein ECTX1999_1733 [Escherichia coli TX1999]EHV81274.1 hypothetical protein ECDEC7A_1340 [Escherichia coli DEC7A]EHV88776.1 hypothetical protein ECDEC7C_1340 [Escherichia coli DEC7C]EHV93743.1 hypothetical protein ECDEC7D_1462 [Escherichia coli DEC7D]EHW03526.1 hypothetical protein ECDEC7E_1279 [Escherichia coli DEC7E]EIQ65284.1 hypothetical protein ECEPECA12_1425 [Escherichia coli EPECa12]KDW85952.1 hypothetic
MGLFFYLTELYLPLDMLPSRNIPNVSKTAGVAVLCAAI